MDDGGQCGSVAATSGGGGQAGSTPGNAAERVQAASRPGVDGGSAMPPFAPGQGRARVVAPSLSGLAVGTPRMAGSMPGDAAEQAGSGPGADGGSALPPFASGQGCARAEASSACRMAGSTSGLVGSTSGLAAGVQCLSDEDDIDAQAHGIAMSDAGSNLSFNGGTTSETHYRVNLRVPSYIVYLQDDNTDEIDAKEHVVEVNDVNGYSMCNLLADLAYKTKWGIYQEPVFWYWDSDNKGLQRVVTDADLHLVFQKFDSSKIVPFVVEFITNRAYKSSITLEKLEKLSVRRNPNISLEASSSEGSDDDSVEIEEKVDPSWMDDEDIFLDDHEVFVSLGLRAEEEAARMNLGEDCFGLGGHHATILVNDEADNEPRFAIDKENPNIRKGETFPSMVDFRQALKHDAILNEFQVHKVVTDKKRYRAECKANGCPWRIVANKLVGQPTIEVTMISFEHECMGTNNLVSTMALSKWVSDRVIAWLRKKPSLGTVDLQDRLLEKYGIEVGYNTVWAGRKLAMDSIYGAWEDNFQYLFRFRAELLNRSPGSIMEIAMKPDGDDVMFDKLFVAMKPCVDGFLRGCRPYLGIDSTALNGKYKGQLASAIALDGNNWMYPVAWAIFNSKSSDNWTWFMTQLEKAIGHPPYLAISTDACKGLDVAVKAVFPGIEHRECMRHVWANFKKYYRGEVFDKNMWPAARAYKIDKFHFHFNQVIAACSEVVTYMNQHHNHKWSRSMFSNMVKCDYINNNLAKSFNSWIKKIKDLPIVDLIDMLRQMTLDLWDKRRRIAMKLSGTILPIVIKQLKAKTRGLRQMKVSKGLDTAEVFGFHHDMTPWRHIVELNTHTCSFGEWQMTGKSCPHALAFIQMFWVWTWLLMSMSTIA